MCDHGHGGSCAHEHTEEPELERGAQYTLYQYLPLTPRGVPFFLFDLLYEV